MALFSRRTLQRVINENARFLTQAQIEGMVMILNRPRAASFKRATEILAGEWELIIMNALSQFAKVEYEPSLSGPTNPDMMLTIDEKPPIRICAEISSVSNRGSDDANPSEEFIAEFKRVLHKRNLGSGGFSIRFGDEKTGEYRDQKLRLRIPKKGDQRHFIKQKFGEFLDSVKGHPAQKRRKVVRDNENDVAINYVPGGEYLSSSHALHSVAYSLRRNPIFNRLKEKDEQLKKSGFQGPCGIILCDSDSTLLHNQLSGLTDFTSEDIIREFFRKNTRVSFVLLVSVQETLRQFSTQSDISIESRLFSNEKAEFELPSPILSALHGLKGRMPKLAMTPVNAGYYLRSKQRTKGQELGMFTLRENEISISSRSILRLLAGEMTLDELCDEYRTEGETPMPKGAFKNKLERGRMIEAVEIIRHEEDDDDEIVFRFGEPDPAISPFRVPDNKPDSFKKS